VNILIGKQRYASTSDRQRERLQSTITTYAIRHHADEALKEQAEGLRVLGRSMEVSDRFKVARDIGEINLDRFIDGYIEMVDRVMSV
jgi:hypothetical protein